MMLYKAWNFGPFWPSNMTCLISTERGKASQMETFLTQKNPKKQKQKQSFSPLAPREIPSRAQYCKVYI